MEKAPRYTLTCQGIPADKLAVMAFEGEEGLSRFFRYRIDLRYQGTDLDVDKLLSAPCSLNLSVADIDRNISGILNEVQVLNCTDGRIDLRADLVPRLWQLDSFKVNEIYLDKSVDDIARIILAEAGFTSLDYEIRLDRKYRKWPYRCQYNETHFEFLQRIFSREGIYFYFDHTQELDKLIIVDSMTFHDEIPQKEIQFQQYSGLDWSQYYSTIRSLVMRQKRLVRKVILRDYNDEKPSTDITGEAEVDAAGSGEFNLFGLNIESPEEGKQIANVVAESLKCQRQTIHAETMVPGMAPGLRFKLKDHGMANLNRQYLIVSMDSTGHDPTFAENAGRNVDPFLNTISAIPADSQFRPELVVERQKIHGALDAIIDAESDGLYAELDDQGRYKVVLPFDRQDRDSGKASHWIRMSQAFAGEMEGMHFPLRKGAHVLLGFIGGDPDRPIITGAMPNAGQPSIVTADSQTKSKIRTRAGNLLEIEDKAESNRIKLYSPHQNTYFHLGASNHPGDGLVFITEGIERKEIGGGLQHTYFTKSKFEELQTSQMASGDADNSSNMQVQDGSDASTNDDGTQGKDLFLEQNIFTFTVLDEKGVKTDTGTMTPELELTGNYHVRRIAGDVYTWTDGNEYSYGGGNAFSFGNSYEEVHAKVKSEDDDQGILDYETFDIPGSPEYVVKAGGEYLRVDGTSNRYVQAPANFSTSTPYVQYVLGNYFKQSATSYSKVDSTDRYIKNGANYIKIDANNRYHKLDTHKWYKKDLDDRYAEDASTGVYRKVEEQEIYLQANKSASPTETYKAANDGAYLRNNTSYLKITDTFVKLPNGAYVKDAPENRFLKVETTRYAMKSGTGIAGAIQYSPGDGQVAKTWSDSFEYACGNNYAWGDTCDYEFGTGYSESHALVDEHNAPINPINKVGWPHDMAGAPNGLDSEGKATFTKDSIDGVHITLDRGSAGIEKSFGDSYEYSSGNSLAVSIGNSEEHVYGTSWEYVTGNSYSQLKSSSGVAISESTEVSSGSVTNSMTANVMVIENATFTMGFDNTNTCTGFLRETNFVGGNLNATNFIGGINSEINFIGGINNEISFIGGLNTAIGTTLGIESEISIVAGIKIELEYHTAKLSQDDSGELEFKAPGLKALTRIGTDIQTGMVSLKNGLVTIGTSIINLFP